jgi:transcriptional regulator with XRE-family HTH domain
MDDYNKKIGETFAKYRKEKGYSQQYVADRMGVSKATVHNWEKGKRQMYAHQFMELCAVLGVDPSFVSKEITDAGL